MTVAGNPHLAVAPARAGAPLDQAGTAAAAVLVHGRDQDELVMLDVARRLGLPGVAYVLPVAAGGSWYPGRYFDPADVNQPHLDWALEAVAAAIGQARRGGFPDQRIVVGGFSQGACLVAELIARRPAPFAGAAVLTGCRLGPREQQVTTAAQAGLPMFFSCGRDDPWVRLADVRASAEAFRRAGASVVFEVSAEREHRIGDDAVAGLRRLLAGAAAA